MQKRLQDPALSFQHTCHDTQCFSSTDFSKNTYQKVAVKVQNHLNFGKQMSQVQGKRKKNCLVMREQISFWAGGCCCSLSM